MPWSSSNPTDRILRHLAEIGAGRCTITDDTIVAEPDHDMSQVLLGLLVLHEDLTYASQQHSDADARAAIARFEDTERQIVDAEVRVRRDVKPGLHSCPRSQWRCTSLSAHERQYDPSLPRGVRLAQ